MQNFNYKEHYKIDALEFDYFEEKFGATLHDERRVHEVILHSLPKVYSSVLDVGCGNAWLAERLTPQSKKVISFDLSHTNTKKAKDRIKSDFHKQTVGDSLQLPFKDNSIDLVVSSEVIEHIADPKRFVSELFRVTKPGGSVIITTPYKEVLQYILCVHCNKVTTLHAHIHSFDEHILAGFHPLESKDFDYTLFGNKLLIFARTYVLLKYLPFSLWRLVDWLANKVYNKPVHILVEYKKTH